MFKLSISTGNAAFGDDPSYEIARILTDLAERIGQGAVRGHVMDENGNKVGTFTLTGNAVQTGGQR